MSKKRLVFATGNQGKVNEFRQMLGDDYEILSMKDIGVDIDIVDCCIWQHLPSRSFTQSRC